MYQDFRDFPVSQVTQDFLETPDYPVNQDYLAHQEKLERPEG